MHLGLWILLQTAVAHAMGDKRQLSAPIQLPEPTPGESGALVRLYLCRHGETDYNAEGRIQGSGIDRPLSDVGLQQAECIGDALREIPLDMVGSSTLTRAM